MTRARTAIAISTLLLLGSALWAQPRLIDRALEAKMYPELQATEKIQDANIKTFMDQLATFWYLVDMAKIDRKTKWQEVYVDPQKFENTFRLLKYTPRNTYIRFVEDIENLTKDKDGRIPGNFILAGFGKVAELHQLLEIKINDAKARKVKADKLKFGQKRIGIELTQFDFQYRADPDKRRAVGSLRKSLSLYFTPGQGGKLTLNMVVLKIVADRLAEGVKFKQLVIDPSPLDTNLDDIIIYDRYNQKPTKISVLGMMANTPTAPHRLRFKQKFYRKVLSHFFRMYRNVDSYSKRDGNAYNIEVIRKLEETLGY